MNECEVHNMKVYICYDRYEHNEFFNVEYVGTRKLDSLKKVREEILPDFINYGPDDCHSFILQVVEMSKKQYEQLLEWMKDENQTLENYGDESSDFFKFMCEVYDQMTYDDYLVYTDGCSDFYEIIQFYGQVKGIEPEDFEDYEDDLTEEFCNLDDPLRLTLIRQYVNEMY